MVKLRRYADAKLRIEKLMLMLMEKLHQAVTLTLPLVYIMDFPLTVRPV